MTVNRTPTSTSTKTTLWIMVGLLLLTTANHLIYLTSLSFNFDELWSIWQTFGSPADVLRWTPNDWPPLYFLLVWGWQNVAGPTPESLRIMTLLCALIGAACFYTATAHIWGRRAGLFAVAVYAALGLSAFIGMLVRAYIMLYALTPVALLLTVRYFERPTLRRAIPLAVSFVVMFFLHYTAAFPIALIGLFSLCVYGRQLWRWWLPAALTIPLPLIDVILNLQTFRERTGYNALIELPPIGEALIGKFSDFVGPALGVWTALFIIATIGMGIGIIRNRAALGKTIALLGWLGSLVAIYVAHRWLGLFQDTRYVWWVLPGLVWWLAVGLAQLPSIVNALILLVVSGLMFYPALLTRYQDLLYHSSHVGLSYFRQFSEAMQQGDVVVVDKNNICVPPEGWDYIMRLYFPQGWTIVDRAGDNRRVWYINTDWLADSQTKADVEQGRYADQFFGPAQCLIRLYQQPPNPEGVLFENGLRFHGADILSRDTPSSYIFHEGESFRVRLWWSVDAPLTQEYSIGLHVATPQGLGQSDGALQAYGAPTDTQPTSVLQWQPGRLYVEERTITLPYPLQANDYELTLTVYQWWDGQRLSAPGVDADNLLTLQRIHVHSW